MSSPGRTRSALALGLVAAFASATPTIQWCAVSWSQVPLSCLLAEGPLCAAVGGGERSCEGSCPEAPECPSAPTGDERDRDRAWCPMPAALGLIEHGPSVTPQWVATPPPPRALDPPTPSHQRLPREVAARPPTPPDRPPPSIRGPPLA